MSDSTPLPPPSSTPSTPPTPGAPASAPAPAPRGKGRWIGLGLVGLVVAGSVALNWLLNRDQPDIGHQPPPQIGEKQPSPTEPAQTGPLSITTVPAGAVVFVDDRIVGTSPLTAVAVAPGSHAVRCELTGYAPAIAQADPGAALKLTLVPVAYAELRVTSKPTDARVLIDGEFRGRTPATVTKLSPGPHELIIQKENYSTYQATQVLHAGERKDLTDIVLDNKILAMLQELCATEPRLISNHLDLAHYYYINNQMDAAALEYARVIELSKLPMEILPESATEAEREQVKLNYDWDKQRVKSEIDKHTRKFREYFGKDLDFDTFLKKYREYTARRWEIDDADWVASEADLQIAVGNPSRAAQLFSDVLTKNPDSIAAACGLARAWLMAGNARDGLPAQVEAAKRVAAATADPKLLKGDDKKYAPRSLRWLAAADLLAARQAPPAARETLHAAARADLEAAEKLQTAAGDKADGYETAQLLRLQAHLLRQKGENPAALLTQALTAAQDAQQQDKDRDHRDRNATLVEQLLGETATALQAAGQPDAAAKMWTKLAEIGDPNRPFKAQAVSALKPDAATRR